MDKWQQKAKSIIRTEMSKNDMDFVKLSEELNLKFNEKFTNKTLANIINNGNFTFKLTLKIFEVLNVVQFRLKDEDGKK